jgi:hypothetical protein
VNAPRALVLAAVIAAAGCGPSGPGEDAASAPLGTGIPIAPPGAVGARFDETAGMTPTPAATRKPPTKGPPTSMPSIPPDPFDPLAPEDPIPKGKAPGSTPKPEIKKPEDKKEMEL